MLIRGCANANACMLIQKSIYMLKNNNGIQVRSILKVTRNISIDVENKIWVDKETLKGEFCLSKWVDAALTALRSNKQSNQKK